MSLLPRATKKKVKGIMNIPAINQANDACSYAVLIHRSDVIGTGGLLGPRR